MAHISEAESPFEIKFTSREVSAWGGMALMKRMQHGLPESGVAVGFA
jgi:hypothetical protein